MNFQTVWPELFQSKTSRTDPLEKSAFSWRFLEDSIQRAYDLGLKAGRDEATEGKLLKRVVTLEKETIQQNVFFAALQRRVTQLEENN